MNLQPDRDVIVPSKLLLARGETIVFLKWAENSQGKISYSSSCFSFHADLLADLLVILLSFSFYFLAFHLCEIKTWVRKSSIIYCEIYAYIVADMVLAKNR